MINRGRRTADAARRRVSTLRWRVAVSITAGVLTLAPCAGASDALTTKVPSQGEFQVAVDALRREAETHGIRSAVFDAAFAGLTPDPTVSAMTRRQPEELKSVGSYLAAQITRARVTAGRALLSRWHDVLADIEKRYGVPPSIVIAVWGLETNYGASTGSKDVIRSMATLAAMNYRPDLYRAELMAALELLQSGAAARSALRGSWAGAMGQPQFMPSSFKAYAVDGDHDGRRDIWTDVPDSLASIANFLASQGWRPKLPWGFEVRLPPGLDLADDHGSFADWVARGVVRPGGAVMPVAGAGVLYFPSGSAGPAFLATSNFEVIKTYNFSDAYVLGVGELSDQIDGRPTVEAAWPTDPPISRDDRIALQARLSALGYPVDNREGRISLALRDTIRSAQMKVGMVPDGNPTSTLLEALRAAP